MASRKVKPSLFEPEQIIFMVFERMIFQHTGAVFLLLDFARLAIISKGIATFIIQCYTSTSEMMVYNHSFLLSLYT